VVGTEQLRYSATYKARSVQ